MPSRAPPDDADKGAETALDSVPDSLREQIARDGFAFVPADRLRPLLGHPAALTDWEHFATSWNDLQLDTYLPDGHRYRRRRHATLSVRAGEAVCRLEPHQPHYQSIDYNPLVGGIERWFEPIQLDVIDGPSDAACAGVL